MTFHAPSPGPNGTMTLRTDDEEFALDLHRYSHEPTFEIIRTPGDLGGWKQRNGSKGTAQIETECLEDALHIWELGELCAADISYIDYEFSFPESLIFTDLRQTMRPHCLTLEMDFEVLHADENNIPYRVGNR